MAVNLNISPASEVCQIRQIAAKHARTNSTQLVLRAQQFMPPALPKQLKLSLMRELPIDHCKKIINNGWKKSGYDFCKSKIEPGCRDLFKEYEFPYHTNHFPNIPVYCLEKLLNIHIRPEPLYGSFHDPLRRVLNEKVWDCDPLPPDTLTWSSALLTIGIASLILGFIADRIFPKKRQALNLSN